MDTAAYRLPDLPRFRVNAFRSARRHLLRVPPTYPVLDFRGLGLPPGVEKLSGSTWLMGATVAASSDIACGNARSHQPERESTHRVDPGPDRDHTPGYQRISVRSGSTRTRS